MLMFRLFIVSCLSVVSTFAVTALPAADLDTVAVALVQTPRVHKLDGVVEAVQQTTISAQISGQVEEIFFDIDDFVEQGEVIIRLKDKQPAAQLKKAQAGLKEATARLEEAGDEYERVKGVFAKQAVSQKAMDAAEAARKAAQAKFEAARAGLESAQEQFEYTRVRAPYSGIVTERHIELGETAQPGKKLISGLSLEHLRVRVDVPQAIVNQVREASAVWIETSNGVAVPVTGKTVFPYAEAASHTFRVRLEFSGGDTRLFPGMFVKAVFETGSRQALVVPTRSIVKRSEVTAVYVRSSDGRINFRAIRRGRDLSDGRTEILAGLKQDEQVAIDPIAAGAILRRQRNSAPAE